MPYNYLFLTVHCKTFHNNPFTTFLSIEGELVVPLKPSSSAFLRYSTFIPVKAPAQKEIPCNEVVLCNLKPSSLSTRTTLCLVLHLLPQLPSQPRVQTCSLMTRRSMQWINYSPNCLQCFKAMSTLSLLGSIDGCSLSTQLRQLSWYCAPGEGPNTFSMFVSTPL